MSFSIERTLARYTVRQVLARRRALALIALGLLPVLLGLLLRGEEDVEPLRNAAALLEEVVALVILPLVALVIGTGVFGAEIEDGTAVFVLGRPVARWRIVLVRLLVAGAVTALLVAPGALAAGLVAADGAAGAGSLAGGFALALAVGAFLYCAVFLALSLVTRRALIVGFAYVIVWEGTLSRLPGTHYLSVRHHTLALAEAFSGAPPAVFDAPFDTGAAVVMAIAVFVLSTVYAIHRLRGFEVGESV